MARVPSASEVGGLLTQLVGRDVQSHSGTPAGTPAVVATYVADSGDLRAVAKMDLAAAASLAAALTMVPSGQVDEAIAAGELPEGLLDNFREVCNVMASLVSGQSGSCYLGDLRTSADDGEELPDAAARLDVMLAVTGYQSGSASFLAA